MRIHRSPEAPRRLHLPPSAVPVPERFRAEFAPSAFRLAPAPLRTYRFGLTYDSSPRECRPSVATVEFAPYIPMSISRRSSVQVSIGAIRVGGGAPIVIQSMTNTDTADVEGTARQVQALARAGSELVRITVNTSEAAAAVAPLRERLERAGAQVPLIGDFHFNGHKMLREHPACAYALPKVRCNQGN